MRRARRQAAKARANIGDVEVQKARQRRGERHCDQHSGPIRSPAFEADDDGERQRPDQDRQRLQRTDGGAERFEFGRERRRLLGDVEPEQILDLTGEDDDRDGGGEADDDRQGDIFDVTAPTQQPDGDEQDTGHHRRQHEPIVALPLDKRIDQHNERARRPADLKSAAA